MLRRRAEPVAAVTDQIRWLIEALFAAMERGDGIGLAAPQVGILKRIIVLDPSAYQPDRSRQALINPVIVGRRGSVGDREGCLSLPGIEAQVRRAAEVDVEALTVEHRPIRFVARDLEARIIQHEVDHLDGILMIDRVPRWTRWHLLRHMAGQTTTRLRHARPRRATAEAYT